eukprot:2083662-Rhodomonas_salina.1
MGDVRRRGKMTKEAFVQLLVNNQVGTVLSYCAPLSDVRTSSVRWWYQLMPKNDTYVSQV